MSWHKITLPLTMEIDPTVVELGKLGWACYERENKPEGFGMFHATRGIPDGIKDEIRIVYLTPVASKLCKEIIENYEVEPCEAPARDEPDIAFVLGDPKTMGQLADKYQRESSVATAEA